MLLFALRALNKYEIIIKASIYQVNFFNLSLFNNIINLLKKHFIIILNVFISLSLEIKEITLSSIIIYSM